MAIALQNDNQADSTDLTAPVKNAGRVIVVKDESPLANWLDTDKFCQMQRVAQVFCNSQLAPEHFRGKLADCIIAVQMAARLGIDPFMFIQKAYVVHGKPGIEAQLKIALCNDRGPFAGPIQWRFEGEPMTDGWTCTAYAKNKTTGELCEMAVSWATVKAEGWLGKTGSKWKTMPDKMFKYRSASWLIDVYCPEVTMGLMTADEAEESSAPAPEELAPRGSASAFAGLLQENVSEAAPVAAEAKEEPANGVPARRKAKAVVEGQTEIPVEADRSYADVP